MSKTDKTDETVFGSIFIRHMSLKASVSKPWDWFGDPDEEHFRTYPENSTVLFFDEPPEDTHPQVFLEKHRLRLEYDVDKWCFYEIDQHLAAFQDGDYDWSGFSSEYELERLSQTDDFLMLPERLGRVNDMCVVRGARSNYHIIDIAQKTTSVFNNLVHRESFKRATTESEFRRRVCRPSDLDTVRRLRDRISHQLFNMRRCYEDHLDIASEEDPDYTFTYQYLFKTPKQPVAVGSNNKPSASTENDENSILDRYYTTAEVMDKLALKTTSAVTRQCHMQVKNPSRSSVYKGCKQLVTNGEWFIPKSNFV